MTAESVRAGACVTSGAEKLAAKAGKGGRADGSETPALRASSDANAELLHALLQSRSLQAKTRGSAVRTRHDSIALLENSQDRLALRLF